MLVEKIALGSANFGLPYGVANTEGQLAQREVELILNEAFSFGVHSLDTAVGYGESESVLGRAGVSGWNVVTKLPPLPDGVTDPEAWVRDNVKSSLLKLGLQCLDGLLLHKPGDLLNHSGKLLYKGLRECKESGFASRIGISIYDPEELDAIMPMYQMDIVQAPFNVMDRRIQRSGWLTKLQDLGVETHARSAFLQGLLLMTKENRPQGFAPWDDLWEKWHAYLKNNHVTALESCLGFVMARPEIGLVVLGVDSFSQLKEILDACKTNAAYCPESIASDDIDLINPSRWGLR